MKGLFPLNAEGTDEGTESLWSFICAIACANGLTSQQLGKYIGPLTVRSGPFEGRPISIGRLGLDINGHSEKTELLLWRLEELGFSGLERTTFIAFKLLGGRSSPGLLKQMRAWCSACFQDAINAKQRPYDKLLWGIRFIDRCPYHQHSLAFSCPSCSAQQKKIHRDDSTKCIHCGSSLIYAAAQRESRKVPTRGEPGLLTILRIANERPQFSFSLDAVFKFIRAYQKALMTIDVDQYRKWSLNRRGEQWMRFKRQVPVVSLLAYAHSLDVPIRFLLERPEEAIRHLKARGASELRDQWHKWSLVLENEDYGDYMSAINETAKAEPSTYLASWDEQLWVPEYAISTKYLSGRSST